MYVLINKENVVVDILFEIRFVKLQSESNHVISCPDNKGTGVLGSDNNTVYPLVGSDLNNSQDAVTVMQFAELPENCKPNYWIYDTETKTLVERYSTSVEKRENAYETEAIIEWQGDNITVDDGNKLWQAYTAEGKVATAQELTEKIAEAKAHIREIYPNKEQE